MRTLYTDTITHDDVTNERAAILDRSGITTCLGSAMSLFSLPLCLQWRSYMVPGLSTWHVISMRARAYSQHAAIRDAPDDRSTSSLDSLELRRAKFTTSRSPASRFTGALLKRGPPNVSIVHIHIEWWCGQTHSTK